MKHLLTFLLIVLTIVSIKNLYNVNDEIVVVIKNETSHLNNYKLIRSTTTDQESKIKITGIIDSLRHNALKSRDILNTFKPIYFFTESDSLLSEYIKNCK